MRFVTLWRGDIAFLVAAIGTFFLDAPGDGIALLGVTGLCLCLASLGVEIRRDGCGAEIVMTLSRPAMRRRGLFLSA